MSDDVPGRVFSLELPWPSRHLHSHARGGRVAALAKSRATRDARALARLLARAEIDRLGGWERLHSCEISYLFIVPDRGIWDVSNVMQSCKPYVDGLVDAGVMARDDWMRLRVAGADGLFDPRAEERVVKIKIEELLPWSA